MTCLEAIREVFDNESGVLSTNEVVAKIYAKYPDQPWKKNTITAHLIGLSVNHATRRHYPLLSKQAFLFTLGKGRYRCWHPEQDGYWEETETGVQLVDKNGDNDELEIVSSGMAVSLERDLEQSLLANMEQLETGLRLYEQNELIGYQLNTGVVGRIDILAIDSQENYVVVELKAGEADEKVCGQILRYMGWVSREIAEGKSVRGIIVANSFHERIKYAVGAMPNVILKRYEIRFNFLDA